MLVKQAVQRFEERGVFLFSVDFLIGGGTPTFLELHYPARGFAVLFEPFRGFVRGGEFPVALYARILNAYVDELRYEKIMIGHNDCLLSDAVRPRRAFYGLEFKRLTEAIVAAAIDKRITICDDWSKTEQKNGMIGFEGVVPEFIVLDDVDPEASIRVSFPQQMLPQPGLVEYVGNLVALRELCNQVGIRTTTWMTIAAGENVQNRSLIDNLGRLVVAKESRHLPSWHGNKKRAVFLDLEDRWDQRMLARIVQSRSILLESAVTTSVDDDGHFGELRIHCCVEKR
jgi:hypothetical protein